MKKTKIEWCDSTVNPVIGCTNGCPYCYAERLNRRFHWTENFRHPEFFPNRLAQLNTKQPAKIFMNSMSDIADWSLSWAVETTCAMKENPQHRYLFLTKRPNTYMNWHLYEDENVWCGFTITSDDNKPKPDVAEVINLMPEANWFVSVEPMHGPINLLRELDAGLKWIIIGAETGSGKGVHAPLLPWINNLVAQAELANVPVFMKESLRGIVPDEDFKQDFPAGLINLNLKQRRLSDE